MHKVLEANTCSASGTSCSGLGLLFFADHRRLDVVGASGDPHAETSNVDRELAG